MLLTTTLIATFLLIALVAAPNRRAARAPARAACRQVRALAGNGEAQGHRRRRSW
jgi:hypothetical protein